jgi:hypothetical protein
MNCAIPNCNMSAAPQQQQEQKDSDDDDLESLGSLGDHFDSLELSCLTTQNSASPPPLSKPPF